MARGLGRTGRVGRARRGGYTLVEILVVIAIIGLLVALLFPAINAARAAAQRTGCSNNVRQIALGVLQYESAQGHFPLGQQWVSRTPPNNVSYSWAAMILPFIEEQAIYDRLDLKKSYFDPAIFPAATQKIALYLCPSTSQREEHRSRDDRLYGLGGFPGEGLACIDYLGISGPDKDEKNPMTGQDYGPQRGVLVGTKGLLRGDKILASEPVRNKDITDGLSHTVLISECSGRGLDADGDINGAWVSGRNVGHVDRGINVSSASRSWKDERIFSEHTGGAFFVACDGSTHFVLQGIDDRVILALCSRDGKETIVSNAYE